MGQENNRLRTLRERMAYLQAELGELSAQIDEHLQHSENERHLHVVDDFLEGYEETG